MCRIAISLPPVQSNNRFFTSVYIFSPPHPPPSQQKNPIPTPQIHHLCGDPTTQHLAYANKDAKKVLLPPWGPLHPRPTKHKLNLPHFDKNFSRPIRRKNSPKLPDFIFFSKGAHKPKLFVTHDFFSPYISSPVQSFPPPKKSSLFKVYIHLHDLFLRKSLPGKFLQPFICQHRGHRHINMSKNVLYKNLVIFAIALWDSCKEFCFSQIRKPNGLKDLRRCGGGGGAR